MSKHHLRKNKECLNCGTIVSERYCSHCGQENTETRQTFGHLARHFFEDLTHYDSGFWKTIKFLLFRPAYLTKEFLAGKRVSYVPPVRLYIFVSFLCFFLPAILPDFSAADGPGPIKSIQIEKKKTGKKSEFRTSVFWSVITNPGGENAAMERPNDYSSIAQMDSLQALLPASERYNWLERKMAIRIMHIYHQHPEKEINAKFFEGFLHSIPKILFIYMPIFAFTLYLFHSKKRWLYFDHAIFTLHNFSFLLLVITILNILDATFSFFPSNNLTENIAVVYTYGFTLYLIYYFFRAHRKMYAENWFISTFKSLLLLIGNVIIILILAVVSANVILFNIH